MCNLRRAWHERNEFDLVRWCTCGQIGIACSNVIPLQLLLVLLLLCLLQTEPPNLPRMASQRSWDVVWLSRLAYQRPENQIGAFLHAIPKSHSRIPTNVTPRIVDNNSAEETPSSDGLMPSEDDMELTHAGPEQFSPWDDDLRNGIWPRSANVWIVAFWIALLIIRPWETLMPSLAQLAGRADVCHLWARSSHRQRSVPTL